MAHTKAAKMALLGHMAAALGLTSGSAVKKAAKKGKRKAAKKGGKRKAAKKTAKKTSSRKPARGVKRDSMGRWHDKRGRIVKSLKK